MPFLTVAGITLRIDAESAAQLEPLEIGEEVTAFDGGLISTVRGEKQRWQFGTIEMEESDFQTLRAAVQNGQHVAVDGDAIDGGPLTCRVKITGAPYVRGPAGVGFTRTVTLLVLEA
jgi:hypothetical protein